MQTTTQPTRQQIEVEERVMQLVNQAQESLRAATELVDSHCNETLQPGSSFVVEAFSGSPVLDAMQAVRNLETVLLTAKFETVGEI